MINHWKHQPSHLLSFLKRKQNQGWYRSALTKKLWNYHNMQYLTHPDSLIIALRAFHYRYSAQRAIHLFRFTDISLSNPRRNLPAFHYASLPIPTNAQSIAFSLHNGIFYASDTLSIRNKCEVKFPFFWRGSGKNRPVWCYGKRTSVLRIPDRIPAFGFDLWIGKSHSQKSR